MVDLRPGMRVLDLGCGQAVSSVFLAKEFDVQVWAVDPMVSPSDNWKTVSEARHNVPFAGDFFDAIVSIDSYHYYLSGNARARWP